MVVGKQDRDFSAASWFALHEFFDQELRQARCVMADDDVFFEQIVQQTADAHRLQFSDIYAHGRSFLRGIPASDFRRDNLIACHDPVE